MRDRYDVTIGGASMWTAYGLTLTDDTDLGCPEPKTYTVDIPGGNGVIDLTEALTGDVAYEMRDMELVFKADKVDDVPWLRGRLMSAFHGRRLPFQLGFEPEYTYTGRFSVEVVPSGVSGAEVVMKVTADPYKKKEQPAYRLNATGGKLFRFESGRRPVHPVIECSQPCFVTWNGVEYTVPAGTHRLNDVTFTEGFNEIYINSYKIWYVNWNSFADGTRTWDDVKGMRWDEIQKINGDLKDTPMSWNDLYATRWSELAETKYEQLDYGKQEDLPESIVYLKYDWEDL